MIMAPCLAPIQLAPSWLPRHRQLCVDANVDKKLGANWVGTETFDFGATNNGAKRMVYFLKSYCQGHICEFFLKRTKKQKRRRCCRIPFSAWLLTKPSIRCDEALVWRGSPSISHPVFLRSALPVPIEALSCRISDAPHLRRGTRPRYIWRLRCFLLSRFHSSVHRNNSEYDRTTSESHMPVSTGLDLRDVEKLDLTK
jgi:hypothetical protein